jgi:hypothetical protein
VGAIALIVCITPAVAEETPGLAEFAKLPAVPGIHEQDGSGSTGPTRPIIAPDIGTLLADPAIRDFVDLSENAYDFNDPDSIPGFGRLPPHDHRQSLVR